MKNLDSDTLFGVRARGSTRSMLGYGLCKLVAGETALCEYRHLQTSPLFKIYTFYDILYLHTVCCQLSEHLSNYLC